KGSAGEYSFQKKRILPRCFFPPALPVTFFVLSVWRGGAGDSFFAGQYEGALAAVVGVGADGEAGVLVAVRFADADAARLEVDLRTEEVALVEQVDELAGADGLHHHLAGGAAARLAGELHLDVRRTVARHVARVHSRDALVFLVLVPRHP